MDRTKVLITGATGFVGSNLARELVKKNFEVHIITRKNSNTWRLTDILDKLYIHKGNLLQEKKLKKIVQKINPKIIYHLANAGIYGGKSASEKELIEVNFLGTVNIINAANEINYSCFINTGSSSEYGPKEQAMKETDICLPNTMYGITKHAATLYSTFIGKYQNRPILTFRLFSPFGPYDEKTRLVSYTIINSLQNKDIYLANPKSVRDYIFIEDIIDLFINCPTKVDKFKGEIFNVGSGEQNNIGYVVKMIMRLTGSKSRLYWGKVEGRSFDTQNWEADISKTKKSFNWKPHHMLKEGLQKSIFWFKKNLNLYS